MTWIPRLRRAALWWALLLGAEGGMAAGPVAAPGVAIIHTQGGAPGDAVREGAAEMLVLMQIARLQHEAGETGLVAVGDRRGLFPAGAEEALRVAVLHGVPVVKLATGGRVLPAPHGLFLDGGSLSEADAAAVLGRCLKRYGAWPVAPKESGAVSSELHERLNLFQREFTLAASVRLAAR